MATIGVIPARLDASRLARKLLLSETGKPLIQHSWEAARRASLLTSVVIATDSAEIAEVVRRFGGLCEMTGTHSSGTDRVAEVIEKSGTAWDIVVNIQGDEPEIQPETIDQLVNTLRASPAADMATLATPICSAEPLLSPSCTKVVCTADGRALYFSRAAIPYYRDGRPEELLGPTSPWLLHVGLYAYRREFLVRFSRAPRSNLETIERLEQLRALEMGARIQVDVTNHYGRGIDTPEDYAAFVARYRARQTQDIHSKEA